VQFRVRRILLVGFDMSLERGIHWHGAHRDRLNNPPQGRIGIWRKRLDAAAPAIAARGIEVINTSPDSALTAYRKISLHEALNERPPH